MGFSYQKDCLYTRLARFVTLHTTANNTRAVQKCSTVLIMPGTETEIVLVITEIVLTFLASRQNLL